MTAAPLNNGLAKVRKLLPVRIIDVEDSPIGIVDRKGQTFCIVPRHGDAMARALLIRDAMNEME